MKRSLLRYLLPVLLFVPASLPGFVTGAFPTGEETTFSDPADLLTAEEEAHLAVKLAQQKEVTGLNFGFSSTESVATADVDALAAEWAETNQAGNSWIYVLADANGDSMVREGSVYALALSQGGLASAEAALIGEVSNGNLLAGLDQAVSMYGQLLPPLPASVPAPAPVAPAEPVEEQPSDPSAPTTPAPLVLDEEGVVGEEAVVAFQEAFEQTRQANLNLAFEAVENTPDTFAHLDAGYDEWTAAGTLGGANVYMLYVEADNHVYLKASPLYLSLVPSEGVAAVETRLASDLAESPRQAVLAASENLSTMLAAALSGGVVEYPEVDSSNEAPRTEIIGDRLENLGSWLMSLFGSFLPLFVVGIILIGVIKGVVKATKQGLQSAKKEVKQVVKKTSSDIERELRETATKQEENLRFEMERAAQKVADDIHARADSGLDVISKTSVDGIGSALPSDGLGKGHADLGATPIGSSSVLGDDPFKPREFSTFEFKPFEVKPLEFNSFGAGSSTFKPLFSSDGSGSLGSSDEGEDKHKG